MARPLGLSEVAAAHGIHALVNSNMGRALRAVSSERGRDPRRFDLVCFGGGGPVHAAGLAEMLDISRVVVPPFPGVFSSFGLLVADVEHHFVQTYFKTFDEIDVEALSELLEGLWREGRRQLRLEGFDDQHHELITQVDMKYEGQVSDLTVPFPPGPVNRASLASVAQNFDLEHEQSFGYSTDAGYQLVNVRVIARGLSEQSRMPERFELAASSDHPQTSRNVYFGPNRGWADTPVVSRGSLAGQSANGPLIIEEYDSTTVAPPGWTAAVDESSNIILERG